MNAFPRFARSFLVLVALLLAGCSSAARPAGDAHLASGSPRVFDFVALDGTHLSSERTRGRVTVIVLLTTYDLPSQVAARDLSDLFHRHTPRFNAGAVFLEPPRNAPLVQTFAESLQMTFPVALIGAAENDEHGPLGVIRGVPTTIVLDAGGVETWRVEGAVRQSDVEAAIEAAQRR